MYFSDKTHLFLPLHAPLLREAGNTVIVPAQFLGWSKFPRFYGNIRTPPCICISLVKPTFFCLDLHAALLREAGNTIIVSAQFLGWSKFPRLYSNIGTLPCICISLVKPTFFLPLHATLLREAGITVIVSAQFLGWSKFPRLYSNIGTLPCICISLIKPTFFCLSMLRSSEKQGISLLCWPNS